MPNGYSAADYRAAWYTPGGLAGVGAGVAPVGWSPEAGEMPSMRIAPSIGGAEYVDYQGRLFPASELHAFLNTPEGKQWQASGAMGREQVTGYLKTGETAIQYAGGDWRPFTKFRQAVLGKPPTEAGGAPTYGRAGMPTTRYGAAAEWYPPARWGGLEEVTEYARPEYDPAYYKALEAAKPTVSPARYEWMAGLRPELLRQWQATRPVSEAEFAREPYRVEYEVAPVTSEAMRAKVREFLPKRTEPAEAPHWWSPIPYTPEQIAAAEEQAGAWAKTELQRRALTAEEKARIGALGLAKVAAQQRQAQWGAWTGAYPFEEKWYGMAPRERGIYPGRYAPPTRWRV